MKRLISIIALLIVFVAAPVWAMDVTLEWDANSEPDLAGYRVYYGRASGSYDQALGAGDNVPVMSEPRYKVTGLEYGTKYYFVVTAYDTEGYESGFSNEVWTDGVTGFAPVAPGGVDVTEIVVETANGTRITITAP